MYNMSFLPKRNKFMLSLSDRVVEIVGPLYKVRFTYPSCSHPHAPNQFTLV